MERALNLELLSGALGRDHAALPTAEELRRLLAQAELQLFVGRDLDSAELLATGWYLHAVGATRADLGDGRSVVVRERKRRASGARTRLPPISSISAVR